MNKEHIFHLHDRAQAAEARLAALESSNAAGKGDSGVHAALEKAEDYIKQLEKEKKELQAQAEKLRYRIGILTTNVRESDAHLKAALTADSQERARLVEELAHLCL